MYVGSLGELQSGLTKDQWLQKEIVPRIVSKGRWSNLFLDIKELAQEGSIVDVLAVANVSVKILVSLYSTEFRFHGKPDFINSVV